MHIVNAMFGRSLGGIEQAFVDYTRVLTRQNHRVTLIVHPKAEILAVLDQSPEFAETTIHRIENLGQWDVLAIRKLGSLIKKLAPDAAIAHGNRAISLLSGATQDRCPLIGVAHNYNIKRFARLDAALAVSQDLMGRLIDMGLPSDRVFHIPNMVTIPPGSDDRPRAYPEVPTIGAMGRFVPKKGFHTLIEAFRLMSQRGTVFKAVIGGSGDEQSRLRDLVSRYGLEDRVRFLGWIQDKRSFYETVNIFCLPSVHEPFGIVLLEAFSETMPVVTTDSEGPSEIVTANHDALVVPREDPEALADSLEYLLNQPDVAAELAVRGYETVCGNYSMDAVASALDRAMELVLPGERPGPKESA